MRMNGLSLRRRLQLQTKLDPKTGCRNWIGDGNHKPQKIKRYPAIMVNGKSLIASRATWELYRGKIPTGMCVLHKCDNEICVAIKHLYLGTKKQNRADFMKRNPQAKKLIQQLHINGAAAVKSFWNSMTKVERNEFCIWRSKIQGKPSKETRQKISATQIAAWKTRSHIGKPASEETRQKMSATHTAIWAARRRQNSLR